MVRQYSGAAECVIVYISEAHADEEWSIPGEVNIPNPKWVKFMMKLQAKSWRCKNDNL